MPDSPDPAVAAAPARSRPGRRRMLLTGVAGLVVMAGVFWLLLPKVSSYEEALNQIVAMPWQWVVLLAVSAVLNIALYPLTVLVAVPGLGYWHGFVERQAGFLVSNVVPGGGAVAVGTQYGILSQYGVPAAVSAAAVTADAAWTYLLTLGMPAVAVTLLVVEGRSTAGLMTLAVVGLVAVVVSIVAIVVVLRSESGARRLGGLAQRMVDPLFRRLHKPAPDATGALLRFRSQASDLVRTRWRALTVTNVVAQATPFLVLLCAVAGLGDVPDPLTLIEVFAAYSAAILLTSVPLTPGGLGTVDAALIGLLVAFGASGSDAMAADLVWRLVWFLPQLLVGLVALMVYLVQHRRARTAAARLEPV